MDAQYAGTAESGKRQEGSTNPETSQAPEDGPGTPQAERGVRVSDRLDTLDAAVSDILDRMDADDEAYRELRERVERLEAEAKVSDWFRDNPEPPEIPTPTRRVVGMRNHAGTAWPVGREHRWALDADTTDPAEWDKRYPWDAPHTPIYEDAPEPVAEPNTNHVSTSAELVSEPEGLEVVGYVSPSYLGSRMYSDPRTHAKRSTDEELVRLSDANALLAEKDAEIERLERDNENWKVTHAENLSLIERLQSATEQAYTEIAGLRGAIESWKREEILNAEIDADLLARIRELEAREVTEEMGVDLIRRERERQVSEEGWTPEHDDAHVDGVLSRAAACYAHPPLFFHLWPWDRHWWKPGDRVRELAKAGALIAAEIDRLYRAALRKKQNDG